MAQGQQELRRLAAAAGLVAVRVVVLRGAPRGQDDRDAGRQRVAVRVLEALVGQHDHAVHGLLGKTRVGAADRSVQRGRGHQGDAVPRVGGSGGDGSDHADVAVRRDVERDQADGAEAAGRQCAGGGVRPVAQLGHRGQHPLAGLLEHGGGAVGHARDRDR